MTPDPINPSYYKDRNPSVLQIVEGWHLGFVEGNILKYLSRWRQKNGVEDLKKCRWYLDYLIASQPRRKPIKSDTLSAWQEYHAYKDH